MLPIKLHRLGRWDEPLSTLGHELERVFERMAGNDFDTDAVGAYPVDMHEDADFVYPKSWAPFAAMEKRTDLFGEGNMEGIKALEKELLAQNAAFKQWECTEELMKRTREGKALYLHCLPADITGVSCAAGEVAASVFDRYRAPLYLQAGYKPYIIAAMITLARFKNPADILQALLQDGRRRVRV